MKKIILLVLIFFNVMPNIKQGVFSITCISFANAQGGGEGYGSESGDVPKVTVCSSTHTINEWDMGEYHFTETCTVKNVWDDESKTCVEDPEVMADCQTVISNTNGSSPPPDDGDEDSNNGNGQGSGDNNGTQQPSNNNPPPPEPPIKNNVTDPCLKGSLDTGQTHLNIFKEYSF